MAAAVASGATSLRPPRSADAAAAGSAMEWQRVSNFRFCRIAASRAASIPGIS